MKDQMDKAALKMAFMKRVREAFPDDFEAQALEVAAVTLALEAGARMGRTSENLALILHQASTLEALDPWAWQHLAHARSVISAPKDAEGVWKEALAVLQPLGMDIS